MGTACCNEYNRRRRTTWGPFSWTKRRNEDIMDHRKLMLVAFLALALMVDVGDADVGDWWHKTVHHHHHHYRHHYYHHYGDKSISLPDSQDGNRQMIDELVPDQTDDLKMMIPDHADLVRGIE